MVGVNQGALAGPDIWPGSKASEPTPKVPGMPAALAKHLANFDDLDFHVYTGQQWENLHKSHAQDIIVHYPDGHTTKGIPDHIKELKLSPWCCRMVLSFSQRARHTIFPWQLSVTGISRGLCLRNTYSGITRL